MIRPAALLLLMPLALVAQEDLGTLLEQARTARDAERYPEALTKYDAMLALVPTHETALLECAQTLEWAGRYPEALKGYELFRLHFPQRALDADLGLAKVNASRGEYRPALAALEPWVKQGQRQAVLADATYRAWQGQLEASLSRLETWLKTHREDWDALNLRARFLCWAGRLTEARKAYEAVAATAPDPTEALLGLAKLRLWAGDPGQARRFLKQLEEGDQKAPSAQVLVAQCEEAEGHPWRARGRLSPLLAGGPAQRDAREALAGLVDSQGPWLEAGQSRTRTSEGLTTTDQALRARMPLADGHLEVGAIRHRVDDPAQSCAPTETGLALAYPLGSRWRASVQVQHFAALDGQSATGQGAGLGFRPLPGLDLHLDYAKSLFLSTPEAISQRGSIRTWDLGAGWTTGNGLNHLDSGLGLGELSAGSTRRSYYLAGEHQFPWSKADLKAGLVTQGFHFSQSLPLGFFNPEAYRFSGFTGSVKAKQGREGSLELSARGGWQTVNGGASQFTWGCSLALGWAPPSWPLSVTASWSRTVAGLPVIATTDPSAYRENTLAFAVRLLGLRSGWNLLH